MAMQIKLIIQARLFSYLLLVCLHDQWFFPHARPETLLYHWNFSARFLTSPSDGRARLIACLLTNIDSTLYLCFHHFCYYLNAYVLCIAAIQRQGRKTHV